MSGSFVLDGQRFIGVNGGPQFPFTEAVSLTVTCSDQAEVDRYRDRLLDGGQGSGWPCSTICTVRTAARSVSLARQILVIYGSSARPRV